MSKIDKIFVSLIVFVIGYSWLLNHISEAFYDMANTRNGELILTAAMYIIPLLSSLALAFFVSIVAVNEVKRIWNNIRNIFNPHN